MTADLVQRLRDWAGAVAHRDLEAGLREAADAIDAEIRLSGSRLKHLNEAEARLAAAEERSGYQQVATDLVQEKLVEAQARLAAAERLLGEVDDVLERFFGDRFLHKSDELTDEEAMSAIREDVADLWALWRRILTTQKAYSGLSRKEAEKHDKATHLNSSGTSRSHVVPAEAVEGPDDLDLYIERRKAAAYSSERTCPYCHQYPCVGHGNEVTLRPENLNSAKQGEEP